MMDVAYSEPQSEQITLANKQVYTFGKREIININNKKIKGKNNANSF